MTLDKQEYLEYINLHLGLLYFVGKAQKIISNDTNFKEFIRLEFTIKLECRDKFNENIWLLDEYIKTSSELLNDNQIEILEGFKKKKQSDFVIFKCFAKHAIFIDTEDNKIYAVKALADGFDKFFPEFPVLCNTTILPFKDKIIYDGFVKSNRIIFGKNMRTEMNLKYKQAKLGNRIIMQIK